MNFFLSVLVYNHDSLMFLIKHKKRTEAKLLIKDLYLSDNDYQH